MARTLNDIEKNVKEITQNDKAVISIGDGLKMFNRTYRSLVGKFPWPEFLVRGQILETTTIDQELYEWDSSMPDFLNVHNVVINSANDYPPTAESTILGSTSLIDGGSGFNEKELIVPPNEYEWILAGKQPSVDTPRYYKRLSQSGTNYIAIRPTPSAPNYPITVTGIEEPDELLTFSDSTTFILSTADDALEYMVSANWLLTRGSEAGNLALQRAVNILQPIFKQELITTETISGTQ